MIATNDFRRGSSKILHKGQPWLVIDYTSVKPGKGGAYVRTKLKSLLNGNVLEVTFRSGEKIDEPDLDILQMQYLYSDEMHHFMDQDSFEQKSLSKKELGDAINYLCDEQIYKVIYFEGAPISVEPPIFVTLEVKETMPGVKGDTAQGGTKPATLETGLVILVPLFVDEGDKVKVDTRSNDYMERV